MGKESAEINPAGIRLSKKSGTALYLQIYEQFRSMILGKRLRPGERLPASRNLAKELGVSRVIISQGYELLLMEGYVIGKTGSGTFVADLLPDQLLNAAKNKAAPLPPGKADPINITDSTTQKYKSEQILPFQNGTPSLDYFPYKSWHRVANKVLQELKQHHLGYEHTLGYWPLRKAIAAYLRISRAVACETEQVIVVTGSQQGLNLVAAALLERGDQVWMEDPGYPGARSSFEHAGCVLCPVPIEPDGLNIRYAKKKFPDARLVYVTPSHQFPMGVTLSQEKRLELLDWAKQKNSWILEDDYDSEFRYEGRPLASLQGQDSSHRVIYSGTFSKVMFPGLRLAYIVLPSVAMARELEAIKETIDRQSPIMEQIILSRFMEEGYFPRHIRKMRLLYVERQQILIRLLQTNLDRFLHARVSPSGMHLLCELSDKIDLPRFREAIRKEKLVISFVNDYAIQYMAPYAITLGFTAFSKYKLKTAVEKLVSCIHQSLR